MSDSAGATRALYKVAGGGGIGSLGPCQPRILASDGLTRGGCGVAGDGAPGPAQRKQLIDAVKTAQLKTAVVSDSVIARGVVTAFKWYGLDLDAFKRSQIDAACRFVHASPEETEWLRDMLSTFQRHAA